MANLSINPFQQPHQGIWNKMVTLMPDSSFFVKAPIIIPFSDTKPTTFTITGNIDDHITVSINNKERTKLILTTERTTVDLLVDQGRNFIKVDNGVARFEILIAATNYATLNMAWAEQFFNETWVRVLEHYQQLQSRFSIKQIEHQLVWQDLLPTTRAMRILAGKMAVKSLLNMGGTDEGVLDIAKSITGNTPIFLPTLLDMDLYEPEARLLFSSAHDFGGFEFNIWLLNTCATSWQAFIILLNNLDPEIFQLLEVSDRKVRVNIYGKEEVHNFAFDNSECSLNNLLTRFVDCISACRVFANLTLENEFTLCMYQYPLDLAVEDPIGVEHFDHPTVLDNISFFDSCDDSDPYCDGLLGLSIACRLDQGAFFDSQNPTTIPGISCESPNDFCMFFEPCASMAQTTFVTPQHVPINPGIFVQLEITV